MRRPSEGLVVLALADVGGKDEEVFVDVEGLAGPEGGTSEEEGVA